MSPSADNPPLLAPSHDLERRRPVWNAMSELFLDTQMDEFEFGYVARILAESGYSDSQLHEILYREVFPVLIPNLFSVAGECWMFDLEAVEKIILRSEGKLWWQCRPVQLFRGMIRDDWRQIMNRLPEAREQRQAAGESGQA